MGLIGTALIGAAIIGNNILGGIMKRIVFGILILLFMFGLASAQNLYPNIGKHPSVWWDNADHQPVWEIVYDNTSLATTDTTDWFELTNWGSGIFRFAFVCDMVTNDTVTTTTDAGFYASFELRIDTADTRVSFTNYDGSEEIIASAGALSTTPPFGLIYPLTIYGGRWIRFFLTTSDTCSLTVYLGGMR